MSRLLRLVLWLLSRALALLGHGRAVALGRVLGGFIFDVLRIRRRVVEDNLARAFPEKSPAERARLARDCYRHLGRVLVEMLIIPALPPEKIASLVRFSGLDELQAAAARGHGAIGCLAHLGNWELMGAAAGVRGVKFHAITKTLSGTANQQLHASRRRAFGELPPRGSFARGLELLARGEILALIVDQHFAGRRAVLVDYFGRPAATSAAAAAFSLRSGAPVFTVWMTLAKDGVYDIVIRGPLPVPEAASEEERLRLHTQLLTSELEEVVRRYPEQWFWVHRRWKVDAERAAAASAPAA